MCLLVLQVPVVRSRTVTTVYVNIFHEKNMTSKHTKVVIEPPAFIHIVQTDKPIYKPGQTGRWSECGVVGASCGVVGAIRYCSSVSSALFAHSAALAHFWSDLLYLHNTEPPLNNLIT